MEVKIYIPNPALQEYVLNISTVDATLPPEIDEVTTPYPPSPFQSLMFYCNDPISMGRQKDGIFDIQPLSLIVGPQISRVNIRVYRRIRAIRVDFLPGGLYRLLGIPMEELSDKGLDLSDFYSIETKQLNDQLQHSSIEDAKTIVENFLLAQISKLREILPFDAAMKILLRSNGNLTIEQTASLSCLSLKQFERKCKERIGMNPKTYARILRFSNAYRMRENFPDKSWISIAHEAGYFDQMHMIRDFKVFAGVNPSVIEQQLSATPLRMQKDLLA